MPKISVVIPIYNKEEFLIKCLKSVLNQTLDDIEIICVNDFSSDNSLKIINEYRLKDERIKLINFDSHKGVSCARNEGIKIASAPYIGFVDADDFIDLDFYKNLYNKTQKLNPDIVKGELWGLNRLSDKPFMPICYDLNSLIKKNKSFFFYTFTSAIYKKSLIIDFSVQIRFSDADIFGSNFNKLIIGNIFKTFFKSHFPGSLKRNHNISCCTTHIG